MPQPAQPAKSQVTGHVSSSEAVQGQAGEGQRGRLPQAAAALQRDGHLPQRVATGAFILNSGIGKLRADEEAAAQLHGFAAGAYPFVNKLKPADFTRLLAVGEITLGAALLLPVVPAAVAGAGLAAFSGGLLGLYAKTPGMHKEGSLFPTQQGIPLAKDAWMMSIGLGLVIDDLTDRPRPKD